jgi:hypothetical protein
VALWNHIPTFEDNIMFSLKGLWGSKVLLGNYQLPTDTATCPRRMKSYGKTSKLTKTTLVMTTYFSKLIFYI